MSIHFPTSGASLFPSPLARSAEPADTEPTNAESEGTPDARSLTEIFASTVAKNKESDGGDQDELFLRGKSQARKREREEPLSNSPRVRGPRRVDRADGAAGNARGPALSKRRPRKLPSPFLVSTDDEKKKTLYLSSGEELSLSYLGEGQFHKVFAIDSDPTLVIKVPLGNLDSASQVKCAVETQAGFQRLEKLRDQQPYVRGARLLNDIWKDGYHIVERIPYRLNPHELEQSVLARVAKTFANMITDPESYIGDFHPSNVMMDVNGELVMVDPAPFDYAPGDTDWQYDLTRCITAWVDHQYITQVIEAQIADRDLPNVQHQAWHAVKELIASQVNVGSGAISTNQGGAASAAK
jgi:hypothetical protein